MLNNYLGAIGAVMGHGHWGLIARGAFCRCFALVSHHHRFLLGATNVDWVLYNSSTANLAFHDVINLKSTTEKSCLGFICTPHEGKSLSSGENFFLPGFAEFTYAYYVVKKQSFLKF